MTSVNKQSTLFLVRLLRPLRQLLDFFHYDLPQGLRNLWRWAPVIWGDRDWDWAYMARILEFKLEKMSEGTQHWHVVGADKAKRRMDICRVILKRLREDEYTQKCMPLGGAYDEDDRWKRWKFFKHTTAIERQDMEMFLKNFRHFEGWWD